MIIGNILAVMFIAAIPWALGLPVTHWHPAMQTKQARRTYRWATYAVCLLFSAVSFVPALVMVWFIPLVAAIWLDIHWYRISRSPAGHAALAFAKEEAKPRSPTLLPPHYDDPLLSPGVMTFPAPAPLPPGWYQHDGAQRWWDGTSWTEHVLLG